MAGRRHPGSPSAVTFTLAVCARPQPFPSLGLESIHFQTEKPLRDAPLYVKVLPISILHERLCGFNVGESGSPESSGLSSSDALSVPVTSDLHLVFLRSLTHSDAPPEDSFGEPADASRVTA